MNQPFHITRLEIDSFKRIVATAICPQTGKPVLLTGDNGQGKSSILDAILWAFSNSGVGKPIMEGQPSAMVGVRISNGAEEYTIKRRAKGENRYLEVTGPEGAAVPKPQTFLDGLVGNLSFDPEAFARLKEKDQVTMLREATGLDTGDLDEEIKDTFTLRAAANKEEKAAEAAYKAIPAVTGAEREIVSVGDLVAERDRAADEVAAIRSKVGVVADLERRAEALRGRMQELKEEFNRVKLQRDALVAEHDAAWMETEGWEEKVAAANDKVRVIAERIGTADQSNADAARHNEALKARAAKHAAWKAAHAKADGLDKDLEKLRSNRAEMIAAAVMPVPGLTIEDGFVALDGIPLSDLNTAKRIEVSTRIAIAQNPGLGVIFVREGALINDENLGIIAGIAAAEGMQLWVERFQPAAGAAGLHIVDGCIATEDGKPAEPVQTELI